MNEEEQLRQVGNIAESMDRSLGTAIDLESAGTAILTALGQQNDQIKVLIPLASNSPSSLLYIHITLSSCLEFTKESV
jgi:hypothetical protein